MNPLLVDLFDSDNEALNRLVTGLPQAFEVVRQEMPKGNPAVGVLREHVLVGFFLAEYGRNQVKVPDRGIERGYDIKLKGRELSIKTGTGNNRPKVLWTVDPLQIGREISRDYQPTCDMLLVNIYWGNCRESIYYIPLEVQMEVHNELEDEYLSAAVGTNHRGISITPTAMKDLKRHKDTLSASVDWVESGIEISPHDRWVEFWEALS